MVEKMFTLVNSRLEGPNAVVIELLDDESTPQSLKVTTHRINLKDFADLGKPAIGSRFKQTLEVVPEPAPVTPPVQA